MKFATTGNTNSKQEAQAVRANVEKTGRESRDRFTNFVLALQVLDGKLKGMDRVGAEDELARKWIPTRDERVVVYTSDRKGDQYSGSRLRVWAAIELGESSVLTLLKIADGYRGDRRDYDDYLTEAFDRLDGGRLDG